MKTFFSGSVANVAELKSVYQKLLPHLRAKTVILLEGPVGAGKTTSVQIFSELLQSESVASPSFAIHHRYQTTINLFLDHVDLYRLNDEDDLESTGFWDLFSADNSVVLIEWGDRLQEEHLPLNWKKIKIRLDLVVSSSQERHLQIDLF